MTTAAPLPPTMGQPLKLTSTTEPTEHTTPSTFIPRGTVTADLHFFTPPSDGSAPFNYVETPPAGHPQRNFSAETHAVPIHDMRGQEASLHLDTHSFAALPSVPTATTPSDFASDARIAATYYPEVEALLLRELPGAHKIVIFDHTIRRAAPDAPRAPVQRVHVDQTPASALARVDLHVPDADEAARLKAGRVRLVNVWRSLGSAPVSSFPLAVAEGGSVEEDELVGVEHRYPDRTGETAAVRFGEGQKWWYWSGMVPGERLLLKCFDSHEVHGKVGRAPHSAFEDPRTPQGAPARESIEVRCLVFG